jgi:hypothetical protein
MICLFSSVLTNIQLNFEGKQNIKLSIYFLNEINQLISITTSCETICEVRSLTELWETSYLYLYVIFIFAL